MQAVLNGYDYQIVEEDPGLFSISLMDLFRTEINGFQVLNIAKKVLYCALSVFLIPPLLWYFAKSNFLFDWSKNIRCLKNRTLLEADPGPLPTANMELFVTRR